MSETKYDDLFKHTSIGIMFDRGLTDIQMGNILNVTMSAVNKWRNGNNKASALYQSRASGYLEGLAMTEKKAVSVAPVIEPKADHVFIASVPTASKDRFLKMMGLLSLSVVDLDE